MAISKEQKKEVVAQYQEWLGQSKAIFLTDYIGLTTKALEDLRRRVREVGGEYHIVKNTLTKIAFEASGYPEAKDMLQGTTAIGFAFEDAPGLAKALKEFASDSEFVRIKGGFLGDSLLSVEQVAALADLPPLPVMRATLLGLLQTPANRLARLLSEPGRQIAQVIKSYADRETDA